jgi:hypothetical protein
MPFRRLNKSAFKVPLLTFCSPRYYGSRWLIESKFLLGGTKLLAIRASALLWLLPLVYIGVASGNEIQNGGFESGLSSWSSTVFTAAGGPTCNSQFAAQSAGTGCLSNVSPVSGTSAAYASMVMPSSQATLDIWEDSLSQTFTVPSSFTSGIVSWDAAAVVTGSTADTRSFAFLELASAGGSSIANSYIFLNGDQDFSWTSFTFDASTALQPYAGQNVTLQVDMFAGGGSVAVAAAVDDIAVNFSGVPEPSTGNLLGLGLGALLLIKGLSEKATVA